jgi:hypothetical protein
MYATSSVLDVGLGSVEADGCAIVEEMQVKSARKLRLKENVVSIGGFCKEVVLKNVGKYKLHDFRNITNYCVSYFNDTQSTITDSLSKKG